MISLIAPILFGLDIKDKENLCAIKEWGINAVQTYTLLSRKNDIDSIYSFLNEARRCRLTVIGLYPTPQTRKYHLIDNFREYSDILIAQIADEPRRKGKSQTMKPYCELLKRQGFRSYVQEGLHITNYGCVDFYGVHSYRRSNEINKAFVIQNKGMNSNRSDYFYVVRMFEDSSNAAKSRFTRLDASAVAREICTVKNQLGIRNFGFFTYRKAKNGKGISQSPHIMSVFRNTLEHMRVKQC